MCTKHESLKNMNNLLGQTAAAEEVGMQNMEGTDPGRVKADSGMEETVLVWQMLDQGRKYWTRYGLAERRHKAKASDKVEIEVLAEETGKLVNQGWTKIPSKGLRMSR